MNQDEVIRLIRKGRRAEERGKALQGCMDALFVTVLLKLLDGWLLMIAIGVAHDHWWPAIPTISYWWALFIVVITPGVFSTGSSYRRGRDD